MANSGDNTLWAIDAKTAVPEKTVSLDNPPQGLASAGDALYVSSQYFVGDESNQAPKLPGYTVFNLRASYQIDKTFQVYARVNNVFDNHYATYGTFFDINAIPNLANNGAAFANPDSLSPAQPRAFYAGLRATF